MSLGIKLQFAHGLNTDHKPDATDITSANVNQLNSNNIHYLPFSVGGPNAKSNTTTEESKTEAARYFKLHNRNNTKNVAAETQDITANFRGYQLLGQIMNVPEGYSAVILKESGISNDEERVLRESKRFQSICHWNMDKEPSPDDKLKRAMDWIEQAEIIHGN